MIVKSFSVNNICRVRHCWVDVNLSVPVLFTVTFCWMGNSLRWRNRSVSLLSPVTFAGWKDRYCRTLHFDSWFKVTRVWKSKTFAPVIPQKFSSNLCGICLALETCWLDEPDVIFSDWRSREIALCRGFLMEYFSVGLHWDMYRTSSFKLGTMVDTTRLYTMITVWMTSTVI